MGFMKRLGAKFFAIVGATVMLSGCIGVADSESTPTNNAVASPPSGTAATPTPSLPGETTLETLPTDLLDPVMIHALCKAQTISYVSKSYNATWAPFEEATTAVRDDGVIGIYI
jgi:hypothetical protein